MPFDPNKYLAEKQAATAQPSTSAATAFDPTSYLQSKGIETLPNQGNIQNGPSTAEALGRAATQGPTAGFGDELSAAASALVPTGTDQALGRSYMDRYAASRDAIRKDNQTAADAHPIVSALGEIASSIPLTLATGGVAAGLGKSILTAGAQGAAYGLGKSNKETVVDAAADAAKSGLLSAGLAGAFGIGRQFIKDLPDAGLSSEVNEWGSKIANSAPKTSFDKEGNFVIQYGKSAKDAFKLGKDMQASLGDPNVQSQIAQELNAQPAKIAETLSTVKNNLGTKWDPILKENGAAPVDAEKAFSKTYSKIDGLFTEGNEAAQKLKEGLKSHVQTIEDSLLAKSPTGTLKDVPLSAMADAQEQLGAVIYDQKAFQQIPGVNGAAKSFFGEIAKAFNHADETVGSGGDLSNINKVYHAIYQMEDAPMTGSVMKALTDPQNVAALSKYTKFVEPFAKLPTSVRESLAPEIQSYLSKDFQTTLSKAQIMRLVTSRGAQNIDATHSLLSLAGLKGASSSAIASGANKLGSLMDNTPSLASTMNFPSGAAQSGLNAVAPYSGSLSVNQDQPQGGPSLQQLK